MNLVNKTLVNATNQMTKTNPLSAIFKSITHSAIYIKLTNWEYWPAWLVNFPTGLMWLWFAARSRSLFFFTTVNPVIETGGVMGESKINILNRIPNAAIPKTIFVEKEKSSFADVMTFVKSKKIDFPLIAKPDIGERGFLVSKIENQAALKSYFETISADFLIQEFVVFPMEISVMYHRMPGASKGKITSFCIKETLAIIGDGQSTIEELMSDAPRTILQLKRFQIDFPALLKLIPNAGEVVELEPIGNHSRGTKFLNGNQYIDAELEIAFDKFAFQMEEIYYGRFDIKCASIEKLKEGKDFSILEFNGIASEPAHIYDPDYPIVSAYHDLWKHWKVIFEISKIQRKKGENPMSVNEFWIAFKNYKRYMRLTS